MKEKIYVFIFLRKPRKNEELTHLFVALHGQISLLGPRPNIKSQTNILNKRTELKISDIKPSITGLAKANKRDLLSDDQELFYDQKNFKSYSILFYIKILIRTLYLVFSKKDIA